MGKVRSEKMFILGMDGMDPRLTRKYVDMGIMPNTKKFIEAGAQRHDLVMLGGHPTVTPSMWTTLSRGCYSNVHGITCFWRQGDTIADLAYNLDSRKCTAEPIWNCFAEAGKKTLVWHWPGCAWPPTSDNPNLSVVDGVSPGVVYTSIATCDDEMIVQASVDIEKITVIAGDPDAAAKKCIIDGLDAKEMDPANLSMADVIGNQDTVVMHEPLVMSTAEATSAALQMFGFPIGQSTITAAHGWNDAPVDAKEMVILVSKGLVRYPCLILKNEKGEYDHIAVYKNKKNAEPLAILYQGKMVPQIVDEIFFQGKRVKAARAMKLLQIDPEATMIRIYITRAMDIEAGKHVTQPQALYDELVKAAGYPPAQATIGDHQPELVLDCMLDAWRVAGDWTAKCLNHCMNDLGYEIVFSHYHAVDLVEHNFIRFMTDKGYNRNPEEVYEYFMEELYKHADDYIGQYLHLLDEDWTVFILSDHAQVCPKHDMVELGEMNGINVGIMKELGLTVLQKDENGKDIKAIDWSKTVAIAPRANQIYLNIKGRDPHGIIEPKDQYEWEEEIMTRLYGYKNPATGKRVVALALRNKDAVLLGMGGPECGDIIYWVAEGYNADHTDSLSTTWGEKDTSVSPIFIAAGKGLKKGYETDRIIREVDVTPTMAVLGNVRMPAQCEGAPAYQILEEGLEV